MKPKSHTLFHFTKSRDTLKNVLKSGFWPRYCLEDIRWMSEEDHEYISYPIVCFCDIPLSRINEHVGFYGEFGLGLTKKWAESNGLNPIMYISPGNQVSKAFGEVNDHANKLHREGDGDEEEANVELAKVTMRYLLAHTKPLEGSMVVDGSPVQKAFYQESEWRYVPRNEKIKEYLRRSDFEDFELLRAENDKTKEHCLLRFSPQDIKYIFVKSDADIPDIINFIQTELDAYPSADLKVLMSRVTSLESISHDV
ncbi:abortive infection system antitoxin AbiGi family protein [Pseudomonas paeninsulae]|uniref:abortive infection system antitoxin AbiGi family protein n=1 Tax=Pseudomonas paeninsulae TaxID=3110772 RepID=UPI002D782466|nr:abortive infection system antitoxin AbiGi family protein [Pseudomonas sp. IT1137]